MKQKAKELAHDLKLWLEDQDENLLDIPDSLTVPVPRENNLTENTKTDSAANTMTLETLKEKVLACRDCPLGKYRLNAVFGVGNPHAKLMFIGEGPGFQEDHQGEPFVGRSGQLLDKIMETVLGLKRSDVFIANIVKCHPMKNPETPEEHSNDRPPTAEEIAVCRHYLEEQISLIKPLCIVPLGSVAAKFLLNTTQGISFLRGRTYDFKSDNVRNIGHTIKIIPTYHPAALLRNPNLKRDTWYDIKLVKALLASSEQ